MTEVTNSREEQMVVIDRDEVGNPTIWCDPEIVDLVTALNAGRIPTVASCSGHGHRPGSIALADGRWLVVAKDDAEHDAIEAMFQTDINGDPVKPRHPLSAEGLRAIASKQFGINDPDLCAELATELLSLRQSHSTGAVGNGWKLVPSEPTEAMCQAGENRHTRVMDNDDPDFETPDEFAVIYKAMIAAAPSPVHKDGEAIDRSTRTKEPAEWMERLADFEKALNAAPYQEPYDGRRLLMLAGVKLVHALRAASITLPAPERSREDALRKVQP